MARKKEESEITDGNIQGLAAFKKEFQKDIMVPKKLLSLKTRLMELYSLKTITDDEKTFLRAILKRDRVRAAKKGGKKEGFAEAEILNQIEVEDCEDKCVVNYDAIAGAQYFSMGDVCWFKKDEDTEIYNVYYRVLVRSEEQYTKKITRMIERGVTVPNEEYPEDKYRIHWAPYNEHYFKKYFSVEEDLLSEKQEEYTF